MLSSGVAYRLRCAARRPMQVGKVWVCVCVCLCLSVCVWLSVCFSQIRVVNQFFPSGYDITVSVVAVVFTSSLAHCGCVCPSIHHVFTSAIGASDLCIIDDIIVSVFPVLLPSSLAHCVDS